MSEHLKIIRDIFPSQTRLSAKQIARVLNGPGGDTKKRTETVRAQIEAGTLLPGIRKDPSSKQLKVSVVNMAAALDGEVVQVAEMAGPVALPAGQKSRFKNPGPRLARLMVERSHQIWLEILEELQRLDSQARQEILTGHVVNHPDRATGPDIIF